MRTQLLVGCLLSLALGAAAASPLESPRGMRVDLSAEASRSVAHDLAQAVAYFEDTDRDAAALARRANAAITTALREAKAVSAVRTRTGKINAFPVYGKTGRSIEAWRMRSELTLESRDFAALSELLGKLQSHLAVGQVQLMSAPETRRKAEDEAMVEAISAFRARAQLVADSFGRPHRILSMSFGGSNGPVPVVRYAKSAMIAADAVAPPLEGGESTLTVSVSGQIELPFE